MTSMDILPEIMDCKDNEDSFIYSKVIKYRKRLLEVLGYLTKDIDMNSLYFQDITLLNIDKNGKLWGELPVRQDFIKMLEIAGIIKIVDTEFRFLYLDPRYMIKYSDKLIDLIGEDKYEEVKRLPFIKLIMFINSSEAIKHTYEIDKQTWIGK